MFVSLFQAHNAASPTHEPSRSDEESSNGRQAHAKDPERALVGCRHVRELVADRALGTAISPSQHRVTGRMSD